MKKLSRAEIITSNGMISINHSALEWYERMSYLRRIHGFTQEQAAALCLTNHKNYWQWERGRVKPNLENQKVIAIAFGVTVAMIFN